MSQQIINAPPIEAGYDWPGLQFHFNTTAVYFPSGCALKADIKANPTDMMPLTTLTTAGGQITVVDEQTITMSIPGTASYGWTAECIYFDIVRTDTTPEQYLGLRGQIPVQTPITLPPAGGA